jgi:hypothetical protein
LSQQAINSPILDLRELSLGQLDQLAKRDDSVLANSIALYLDRVKAENGLPLSSFNSGI